MQKSVNNQKKFDFKLNNHLTFHKPNIKNFPILKIFEQIKKNNPHNIIKFNVANEFAVNLFSKKIINFLDIHKIIEKSLSIDLNIDVNDVDNVINFQNEYLNKLKQRIII